jgi:hypothetical protein
MSAVFPILPAAHVVNEPVLVFPAAVPRFGSCRQHGPCGLDQVLEKVKVCLPGLMANPCMRLEFLVPARGLALDSFRIH